MRMLQLKQAQGFIYVRVMVPRVTVMQSYYIIGNFTTSPWQDFIPLKYSLKRLEYYIQLWVPPTAQFKIINQKSQIINTGFIVTQIRSYFDLYQLKNQPAYMSDQYYRSLNYSSTVPQNPANDSSIKNYKFEAFGFSIGKDDNNEDRFVISSSFIAVADGVGSWRNIGVDSGIYAQEFISQLQGVIHQHTLLNTYIKQTTGEDRSIILKNAIYTSEARVQAEGSCTLIAATIQGEILKAVSLGDCMMIHLRRTDQMYKLIHCTQVQIHGFNMPYQVGKSSKDYINFSSQFAQEFEYELEPGDLIIMGSDGIWDNLYMHSILQVINSHPIPNIAKALTELAQKQSISEETTPFEEHAIQNFGVNAWKGGKPDDLTCICAQILNFESNQFQEDVIQQLLEAEKPHQLVGHYVIEEIRVHVKEFDERDKMMELLGFGRDEVGLEVHKLSRLMEIGHQLMPFEYFNRNAEVLPIEVKFRNDFEKMRDMLMQKPYVFNAEEIKQICQYFTSTFFQHYRLYMHVFSSKQKAETLQISIFIDEPIRKLPLANAVQRLKLADFDDTFAGDAASNVGSRRVTKRATRKTGHEAEIMLEEQEDVPPPEEPLEPLTESITKNMGKFLKKYEKHEKSLQSLISGIKK